MCLVLVAHQIDPTWPLLVLANRDEFYARATAPADQWSETPGLYAGHDLVGGGTWLGARGQRWAAVTNVRERLRDRTAQMSSRGWLVRNYLKCEVTLKDYLSQVMAGVESYAGFNLLLGDADDVWYVSNRGGGPRRLCPGLYGLSNHLLDTPWPKVIRAKQLLVDWLGQAERQPEQAVQLLVDTRIAADADLPATGVPLAWERALSAMFIRTPEYGTRNSTLLTRSAEGSGMLLERTFHGDPRRWTQRLHLVTWSNHEAFSGKA
jgi:uncharacterized protein with NRDE domain